MRALIVGSRGQDGRILRDQLAVRGFEVLGISRSGLESPGGNRIAATDICDSGEVRRLIADYSPEQIYFLAAHHHSSEDAGAGPDSIWKASWEIHVDAFHHFLDAIRHNETRTRIVYASSCRVFGIPACSPQTETTSLNPGCIYGITKSAGMMLARHFRETHGVWASSAILYNHESPLRGDAFLSRRVVRGVVEIKRGLRTHLEIGDLDARVDWGYAPDYTRAMQLILEASGPDDFIVATGNMHSVRDLVEIAANQLALDWRSVVVENRSVLKRPPLSLCGDATRLRQATGWMPQMTFESMIELLIQAELSGNCDPAQIA